VLLFSALACGASRAHETDQYSVPIGREFADLRFYFSEDIFERLQAAVTKTNARIQASLRDGTPTDATQRLQSAETMAAALYAQFPPVINHVETLDLRLSSAAVQRRYSGLIVRYHAPAWIYNHWALMLDITKPARFMRCPTIMIDGTYLGTDKFVHFIHMGYIYFGAFQNAIERGLSEQEAMGEVLEVGAGSHPLSESGILGVLSTGVFSNADLAADYCGLKFFRNLTEAVRLRGEMRPPMLVRDGELWRLNDHVRPEADFMSPFVSSHWDEVLNPSVYYLGIGPFIAEEVRKRCDDVLHWYRDERGRPLARQEFARIAHELTDYYGEEYGHDGDPNEMVTMANVCFRRPERSDAEAPVGLVSYRDAGGRGERDGLGRTALWHAARSGRIDEVRVLVDEGGIQVGDIDGETPLHAAARAGHADVARILLDSGAHTHVLASYAQTALHLAARGGHTEVVRGLLKRGAAVNPRDVFGCTALHDAAARGHREVVVALLKAGADVDAVDRQRNTPLHRAARAGFAEVVEELLGAGANPRRENAAGRSPIDEAKFSKDRATIGLLQRQGNRVPGEPRTPKVRF
jgi:ankyrin repeat protein